MNTEHLKMPDHPPMPNQSESSPSKAEEAQAALLVKLKSYGFECFFDRLIVLPDGGETKTRAGIIIPENLQEKPRKGTILYVGELSPDHYGAKPKVDDRIIYGKYAGSEIKIDKTELIIMRVSDIMFRFPKDTDLIIEM